MKNETITKSESVKEKGSMIQVNKKTLIGITLLLVIIMIAAGVLTKVVPSGAYATAEDGSIIPGTYTELTKEEVNYQFWRVFVAPVEVFSSSSALTGVAIMLFIILIGGTFLVLDKSGVLKYIMETVVHRFSDKKYLLLAIMTLICMALSSVCGILEESITLVPLACAISLALGWDSMVGLGFSLVSIAFGYSAATFNPFNAGLVNTMAGNPVFSGVGMRAIVFVAVYLVLVGFLFFYAKKIEKHPEKSVSYETDKELRTRLINSDEESVLGNKNLGRATRTFVTCILIVFVITAISFIAQNKIEDDSIKTYIGYLPMASMAVLFTVGGLLAGKISGLKGKALGGTFLDGVKTIAPAMPLILFILAITYILQKGMIIDTILYRIYNLIQGVNPVVAVLMIFLVVIVLEFFIGSGTAKAFLLMPLILPLSGMLGIDSQSVVLTFCLGDGLCNILYPTSAIMIIAIGLINVSYGKFLKWSWKLFLLEFAVAIGFSVLSVAM